MKKVFILFFSRCFGEANTIEEQLAKSDKHVTLEMSCVYTRNLGLDKEWSSI